MVDTIYDRHDELYHNAKFGEIEQRAPAVGAKMWCLFFFLSRSDPAGCAVRINLLPLAEKFVPYSNVIALRFIDQF